MKASENVTNFYPISGMCAFDKDKDKLDKSGGRDRFKIFFKDLKNYHF